MIANIRRFAGQLLCLAGTGLLLNGAAQAQFKVHYGGAGNEFGRTGVMQTVGGLWAATGEAPGVNANETDIYVVVANYGPPGPLFARTYNIGGNDLGKDIDEGFDASGNPVYYVTGITQDLNNPSGSRNNVFVLKLDQFGNITWCKTYAGSATISQDLNDEGYDIEVLNDGDLAIVGLSNSNHSAHNGAIMFKIDEVTGNIVWGKQWDGTLAQSENFFTLTQAANGELVAGGGTNEGGNPDVFAVRATNALGTLVWANRYGFPNATPEGMRCMRECAVGANNGRFIIAGNTGSSDALAMLINANGTFFLANRIAAGGWEEAMGVVEGSDGRFNMTGLVNAPANGFGGYDIYIQQLNNALGNIWYRLHGTAGTDQGWSINTAVPFNGSPNPYSLIVCGMTTIGSEQLYMSNVDWNGSVAPCIDRVTTPIHTAITPTVFTMPSPTNWGRKYDNTASWRSNETFVACPDDAIFKTSSDDKGALSDGEMREDAGRTPVTEQNAVSGVDVALDPASTLNAYPNPIKRGSQFNLSYTTTSREEAVIAVSDMAGELIHNGTYPGQAGAVTFPINTAEWAAGTYLIQVTIGKRAMTQRIVVVE